MRPNRPNPLHVTHWLPRPAGRHPDRTACPMENQKTLGVLGHAAFGREPGSPPPLSVSHEKVRDLEALGTRRRGRPPLRCPSISSGSPSLPPTHFRITLYVNRTSMLSQLNRFDWIEGPSLFYYIQVDYVLTVPRATESSRAPHFAHRATTTSHTGCRGGGITCRVPGTR